MAFVPPKDRVFEHSTSNSQSVFTVTGALDTSYNAFSASMSVGDTTIGAVVEPGVAFKAGLVTYSAANEVTMTTAYDSKGTFSAGGVKEVFMGLPAADAIMVDGPQSLSTAQKNQARANIGCTVGIPDVIVEEQQSSGTSGGTSATGSFGTRVLNTLVRNNGSIATLSSNQVTLGAGTYYFTWSAPAFLTNQHQTRLQNITDGTTVGTGSSEISVAGTSTVSSRSAGSAVVTIGFSPFKPPMAWARPAVSEPKFIRGSK
jgi:hypothetical protein